MIYVAILLKLKQILKYYTVLYCTVYYTVFYCIGNIGKYWEWEGCRLNGWHACSFRTTTVRPHHCLSVIRRLTASFRDHRRSSLLCSSNMLWSWRRLFCRPEQWRYHFPGFTGCDLLRLHGESFRRRFAEKMATFEKKKVLLTCKLQLHCTPWIYKVSYLRYRQGQELSSELLTFPPHYPDLALCDLFLLTNLKKSLVGQKL